MSEDDFNIKKARIEVAMTKLAKQYGENSVMLLGDDAIPPVPVISTGALSLDLALGVGGLPLGRIVEIYGPEGSGKSTLALSVVYQAQLMDKICVYIDAEHAIDPKYARSMGVSLDDMFFAQPGSGEEAFDIIYDMVGSQEVDLVIVDSVAALTPEVQLEGGMEYQQPGQQAKMMSNGLKYVNSRLKTEHNETMLIFINQLRLKIGGYGNPETTPGGMSLRYFASVRIDLRQRNKADGGIIEDSSGNVIGSGLRAKIVKNKVGPPLRQCDFDIIYGKGINELACIVDVAVDRGLIQKDKGGRYRDLEGNQIAHGRNAMIEVLASDLDLAEKLKKEILNV